jgi:hypothetical protein
MPEHAFIEKPFSAGGIAAAIQALSARPKAL